MIHFLTTPENAATIRAYLAGENATLGGVVAPMVYPELFAAASLPLGTYVFADLELLDDGARAHAARIWQRLADRGCRLLNHPTRTLRRYDLLRALHRRGINRFEVYRLADGETPRHFPVFLRGEHDHCGSRSPLLRSVAELNAAVEDLRRAGERLDDTLIVEFCDTADAGGVYRKYGAFVVGDRILARHLFFDRQWMVKDWRLLDDALLREECRYVDGNPHQAELREIFAAAAISWGRIDYSLLDGAIQVWEINTNPIIVGIGPSADVGTRWKGRVWGALARRRTALRRLAAPFLPLAPALRAIPTLRSIGETIDRRLSVAARPRAAVHARFATKIRIALGELDRPPS